jgi:hypothetical protein
MPTGRTSRLRPSIARETPENDARNSDSSEFGDGWSLAFDSSHHSPSDEMGAMESHGHDSSQSITRSVMSTMGLHRLHFVSGGVILELERGMSLWFEEDGMGGYRRQR